jgi:hypothetical protein
MIAEKEIAGAERFGRGQNAPAHPIGPDAAATDRVPRQGISRRTHQWCVVDGAGSPPLACPAAIIQIADATGRRILKGDQRSEKN